MSTWTIEMKWRCSHCHMLNAGMSGRERDSLQCTHCGSDKKASDEWVMPDNATSAPHLTGELDRKARLGPNWHCSYCGASSRADKRECEICGARRVGTNPTDPTPRKPNERARTPSVTPPKVTAPASPLLGIDWSETKIEHAPLPEPLDHEMVGHTFRTAPVREPVPPPSTVKKWWETQDSEAWFKGILIVGSIILAICLLYWLLVPNETTARVTVMAWSRSRDLQKRHSYAGEGWRSQAPGSVYSWNHCETRQNGTHDCNPHSCNCHNVGYECNCSDGTSYSCNCSRSCTSNGNGSATCSESCQTCTTPRTCSTCYREECSTCYDQCPTYEDWCRYRYWQWDSLNRMRLAGGGHTAEWPDVERNIRQDPTMEHRILAEEEYAVRWQDEESYRQWRRTYPFTSYERFNVGDRYRAEWTRAGGFTLLRRIR